MEAPSSTNDAEEQTATWTPPPHPVGKVDEASGNMQIQTKHAWEDKPITKDISPPEHGNRLRRVASYSLATMTPRRLLIARFTLRLALVGLGAFAVFLLGWGSHSYTMSFADIWVEHWFANYGHDVTLLWIFVLVTCILLLGMALTCCAQWRGRKRVHPCPEGSPRELSELIGRAQTGVESTPHEDDAHTHKKTRRVMNSCPGFCGFALDALTTSLLLFTLLFCFMTPLTPDIARAASQTSTRSLQAVVFFGPPGIDSELVLLPSGVVEFSDKSANSSSYLCKLLGSRAMYQSLLPLTVATPLDESSGSRKARTGSWYSMWQWGPRLDKKLMKGRAWMEEVVRLQADDEDLILLMDGTQQLILTQSSAQIEATFLNMQLGSNAVLVMTDRHCVDCGHGSLSWPFELGGQSLCSCSRDVYPTSPTSFRYLSPRAYLGRKRAVLAMLKRFVCFFKPGVRNRDRNCLQELYMHAAYSDFSIVPDYRCQIFQNVWGTVLENEPSHYSTYSDLDRSGWFDGNGTLRNPETGTHPAVLLLSDQDYRTDNIDDVVQDLLLDRANLNCTHNAMGVTNTLRSLCGNVWLPRSG